jgi:AbrB family looped-hinge helix DNA binding protein
MLHGKPQIWGVTTVGERGQVVIPVEARKELNLEKGEHLVVISKGKKFIGLVKESEMTGMLKGWLEQIEDYKKYN